MIKSGRAISGWYRKSNNIESGGGNPPNLKDITTQKEKVSEFMIVLFEHHKLSDKVKNILLANGMRFFQKFLCFLQREPKGKYDTKEKIKSNHPFVRIVSLFFLSSFCFIAFLAN